MTSETEGAPGPGEPAATLPAPPTPPVPPAVSAPSSALHQYACAGCGAALEFAPGTTTLVCPYCRASTEIATSASRKRDYAAYLAEPHSAPEDVPALVVRCGNCGATASVTALSTRCVSCRAAIVVDEATAGKLVPPGGVVPFVVDKDRAAKEFQEWATSRWFAPTALKRVLRTDSMVGSYVPHWGFDDSTTTTYRGERGEHYWDTETYEDVGPNGGTVTRTRQVERTEWYPTSGRVSRKFVDVVVPAVTSFDEHMLGKIGPWSTAAATGYDPEYLAGFETPRYTVAPERAFGAAKEVMAEQIERDCRADIGGDEQRLFSTETTDAEVLFRLLLMPVWVASYVFAGTAYDVYVNANTGEVVGHRPYSAVKIALAVLALLVVVAAIVVAYTLSR